MMCDVRAGRVARVARLPPTAGLVSVGDRWVEWCSACIWASGEDGRAEPLGTEVWVLWEIRLWKRVLKAVGHVFF